MTLILAAGMAYSSAMILSGQMIEKDTGKASPPGLGLAFGGFAIGCAIAFAYCVLAFLNDRIVIDGDQIYWRDKLGRDRVRCTSHDIVPLSYSEKQRTPYSSGYAVPYFIYSVMTRVGPIRFDSNMSNSDAISDTLHRMSDGLYAPPQAAAQPSPAWNGDPLDDPDQGNTPIR